MSENALFTSLFYFFTHSLSHSFTGIDFKSIDHDTRIIHRVITELEK